MVMTMTNQKLSKPQSTIEWKTFYKAEQDFYFFLETNGKIIISESNCEPTYHQINYNGGRTVFAPPKYVRAIITISKSCIKECHHFDKELKTLYAQAMRSINKDFKHYPPRFPTIEPDIYQINLWRQSATSSRILKSGNKTPLCRFFVDSDSKQRASLVTDHLKTSFGINASITHSNLTVQSKREEPALIVVAPVNELLNYFGVSSIRLRRESGTQYRVSYYIGNGKEPIRVNYGLIITTGDPAIFETVPQPVRAHKTSNIKEQLKFGGVLSGQFVELYDATFESEDDDN